MEDDWAMETPSFLEEMVRLEKVATSVISPSQDSLGESLQVSTVDRSSMLSDSGISTTWESTPTSLVTRMRERLKDNARRSCRLSLTPHLTQEEKNNTFFGLPSIVKDLLKKHRGITDLYDWQKECLSLAPLKNRTHLIYSLPTSGGKTLVAEVLAFKELVCNHRDVLFILPYVAIVQEKVRGLSAFAVDLGFLVEEYAGNRGQIPPIKRRRRSSIYVATIEKAHFLINSLIENKRIEEIGMLIVDELHMLGDGSNRGAVLEIALVKLIHLSKNLHIIGMSATLGNMEDLKRFLGAEDYTGNFRPVELREFVKIEDTIFEVNESSNGDLFTECRKLNLKEFSEERRSQDPDCVSYLVNEVIPHNSCLVFCPTKKNCENVALLLTRFLPKTLKQHRYDEKEALYRALCAESAQVCPVLRRTLPYGVAYHHSGLTTEERRLIEESYSMGILCCLTCTSTLAAGVNLPAKRVILKSPYTGTAFLTRSRYQQMVGRAGRAGIDSSGESILLIKKGQESQVLELLQSPIENCKSSIMFEDGKGLQLLILSLIGLEVTKSLDELYSVVERTLLAIQLKDEGQCYKKIVSEALENLQSAGLITVRNKQLLSTQLGKASFKGCMDPSTVKSLHNELQTALSKLVLTNHLHLLYLITPRNLVLPNLDPKLYYKLYMSLTDEEQGVASAIGITESLLTRLISSRPITADEKYLLQRFFLTMKVNDLWKQKTLWEVAVKYKEHRGSIQSLLLSATSHAGAISHFCEELPEFWAFRDLLPNFVQRLSHCVTMELIPLMELPSVKRGRARQLYQAGYKTLKDIATADPKEMIRQIDHLPRRVAGQIIAAAKLLLLKKAEDLQEEAEDMMHGIV